MAENTRLKTLDEHVRKQDEHLRRQDEQLQALVDKIQPLEVIPAQLRSLECFCSETQASFKTMEKQFQQLMEVLRPPLKEKGQMMETPFMASARDMDTNLEDKESFMARIQQLEHELEELRKDIEQFCIQQAGPSYLAVATRMHFQRTAGLEQEIENLKKKLAACTRDNINLQEQLPEAYQIKSQLADLHRAEVEKNMEAEKLIKFFQGCVAAAFAERD